MIDNISEPGSWARELAMRPKRCEHCVNYRVDGEAGAGWIEYCKLNRKLAPCSHYKREPGADDDES